MANELDAYKTEQTKLLEAQKARAQERAAINQQKLLKYLEQTSAGQSVGMTESAKIAAANQYSQDVAAADAAYNQGVADLNNYVRDQQKAERDEHFNNVMTTIDSQTWNTTADLENYIKGYEGKVSDTQWQEIQNRLNFYKGNPEQQAAEIAHQQAETAQNWANMSSEDARAQFGGAHVGGKTYTASGINSDRSYGNNFIIKDGDGKKYDVQLAQKIVETDTYNTGTGQQIGMINHFNRLGVEDGGVFTVNGHVYIKLGTDYYEVTTRTGKGKTAPTELINALSGTAASASSAAESTSGTAGASQAASTSSSTTHWEKHYGNNKKHR
jgi:hypothetical protein